MKKQLKQVQKFYEAFGDADKINGLADVFERGATTSDIERFSLRERLQREELTETFNNTGEMSKIDIMDGLGDQLYILFGTILEFGLQDSIEDIFTDIHTSNMSKLCKDADEAEKTIVYYSDQGIETYKRELENGLYAVIRKSDEKILKSINYKPVDLTPYLNPVEPAPQPNELSVVNLPKVVFIANRGDLSDDQIESIREIIGEDKILSIGSERVFKACVDTSFEEMQEYREQKKLTEYINDTNNVKQILDTCWKLRNSVGINWFSLKEMVDKTNMTYKESKAVLDLVYAFGYVAHKNIDNRDFWIILDDFDQKINYFKTTLLQHEQNTAQVRQILSDLISQQKAAIV